jgi:ubiquinone/menaquinone biosynthesis C-methylase UbiE
VLEIGPGIGLNALSIAAQLDPGTLDVLDIQQPMLDNLMRRAARLGITNIKPCLGDARELPFPDHGFDAIYLMGVLGEIPEPERALREIHRVLRPGGRLAIGEFLLDPDFISPGALRKRVEQAGFQFAQRSGLLAYISRFDLAPTRVEEPTRTSASTDSD